MEKQKKKKSYNRLALQGFDFDDMDFVMQYNLDPSIAYTPKINIEMMNAIYNKNVDNFLKEGMPLSKAKTEAGRIRSNIKNEIKQLMK